MKSFFATVGIFSCLLSLGQTNKDSLLLKPVEVISVKAGENMPFAKSEWNAAEIRKRNTGQDIPILLQELPSVVSSSDAGNGIGYTGIRIRGTDATRINITLNNIPYNDAESQGTFLVNIPDIISSATSIQVQRGVGTSTNGAGAFGGSLNISTNELKAKRKLEWDNNIGSFGTLRSSLQFNSGLFNKHFSFDGRASMIRSDGYIDRASSNLQSLYGSMAYIDNQQSLRLNVFTGKEKTYQAWYGVPKDSLETNRTFNPAGTEKPGEPYDNETDNYTQTHYQLFYNKKLNNPWQMSAALFLTRGKGYYEQYKAAQILGDYGLTSSDTSDLVRQLWLDNYFYGSLLNLQYEKGKDRILIGAGWTAYDGRHYGEIAWLEKNIPLPEKYKWYDLNADKEEINGYVKWERNLNETWYSYLELQARAVNYRINGFRNNPDIRSGDDYLFFNPKWGMAYRKNKTRYYFSVGIANKEPNRDDFEAGSSEKPKPEQLTDLEAGLEYSTSGLKIGANLFYMQYKNQLILTGKVNDVGAYVRTNVPNSYRAGLEMNWDARLTDRIRLKGNGTFSRNIIQRFTEYLDEYDAEFEYLGQKGIEHLNSTIAFSPSMIAFASLEWQARKNLSFNWGCKYVSRQYLDNTGNESRSLDPYLIHDLRVDYGIKLKKGPAANLFLQLQNLFSETYEPNGWTYSYFYNGEEQTQNNFFPMAKLNLMAGIRLTWEK
jgi:iron complex outermembrane receptor protein